QSSLYTPYKQAATRSIAANDYRTADQSFAQGTEIALRHGDQSSAGRFTLNRASTLMAQGRFRDSLSTYQQARVYAEASGDIQTSQTIHFALANLYMAFGDRTAAALAARNGLASLPLNAPLAVRMPLLLIVARLEIRERGLDSALPYFTQAITTGQALDDAPNAGTQSNEAEAWDNFGFELMQLSKLEMAEDAFCRAWRLRSLRQDPRLAQSYPLLSGVYYARRDLSRSKFWNDRALANLSHLRLRKPWMLPHRQGQIAELTGDLPEAFLAYGKALDDARRWRTGLIPADQFRTHAEVEISDLFDDFIRVATALPHTPTREQNTFRALQESHAWSLQAQLEVSAGISTRLPAAYHSELATVRRLESQLLAKPDAAKRAEADQRRVKLLEMELVAGMPTQISGRPRLAIDRLTKHEGVLTFHTAEPASQLWLLTDHGLQVARLPGRKELAGQAKNFYDSLYQNSPTLRADGERLLNSLLGTLRKPALALSQWRLVLDDGLFDIPFAALSVNEREFLVDNHTVLQVPTLGVSAASKPLHGSLLGVGDPIFNQADPRFPKSPPPFWQQWPFPMASLPGFQLPRLPASLIETKQAMAAWGSGRLLTGSTVTNDELSRLIRVETPTVLHLATHAIPLTAAGASEQVGLVMSLGPDGQARFFAQRDIMALRTAPALVVMSACQSGQGEQRPGVGVVGLTRAWLIAGSENVVATYWPVLDDAGPFFTTFYRHIVQDAAMNSLGRGRFAVAAALRRAQQTCLRSDSFRAQPRYWAGFFVAGKG
ncbi:MAG: CHAT domain-containing protein, partial [Acidobacteria bacterium]|nr:CHAT domain-containing protein [Acidobacteriota bacterium]